jgi:hypothetical protein
VGETLTANTGGLDREGERSYRWYRANTPDGAKVPIPGAEAASHTPDNNDWNQYLSVEVTVEGYRGAVMSPETGAVDFPRVNWTPAAVTPPLSGGAQPSRFIHSQVGGRWMWIGPGGSGVLLSDDGMNWEQIPTPASAGDSIVDTGLDTDMRFVSSNGSIHSPDGRTWSLLNPNREVRCVAYGNIKGFGMYVGAYGQRGLLYSSDCKTWVTGSPDYNDAETGVFGPGTVTVFDIQFYPQIDALVYDEENQRFIAQAYLGPYSSNKCAYSTDAYAWDGPYNGSVPAAPVQGDAALFSYYYAYPNGVYVEEMRFIDNGRTVSLPQGMAGSFGCFSIDGRPAVLAAGVAVFSPYGGQTQWNFYSLDQPGQ